MLPPAFGRDREGNVFTGVCPSTPMGVPPSPVRMEGYPIPGQDRGYPPSWWVKGYPIPGWGYPIPGQDGGYPIPGQQDRVLLHPGPRSGQGWRNPHSRSWRVVSHPRSGQGVPEVPPVSRMGYPPHQQDGAPLSPGSRSGWGVPPTWTAWHVLATWWVVCPLRSRRRTFLFSITFKWKVFWSDGKSR